MQVFDKKMIQDGSKIDISGNRVGILLNRSAGLISAIYNCFKSGITYIPFDPRWPNARINGIIESINLEHIITTKEYCNRIKCRNITIIDEKCCIGFDKQFIENEVSYILYTSGTTGNPKGVEVRRESLYNFIEGISNIIDFSSLKRIACLTAVSFDIFFLESVMALEMGLNVILANEDEQSNPRLMAKLIEENDADIIQMTPSRMQLLLNYDRDFSCLKCVKEILIGGEAFPIGLLRTLQKKTTAKIYNMYGPTETTIWSTVSELTYEKQINIGKPIKDTEVYIVDENLCILPIGVAGEICIAGKGVAKGYIGNRFLTEEKFIYLPQNPSVRVYRTGDKARLLPDYNLEYLGRLDNQVKLRGHRIELEEIEVNINQFEGINQSIVAIVKTSDTNKDLQAFYTSETPIEHDKLLEYLRLKLPEYMIPVKLKRIESFIQTLNGKIDRKKVLECLEIKEDKQLYVFSKDENMNSLQKELFKIIFSVLGIDEKNILLDEELVDLGFNSITFVQMVVDIENVFNIEFEIEKLWIKEFPTVRSILEYIVRMLDNSN